MMVGWKTTFLPSPPKQRRVPQYVVIKHFNCANFSGARDVERGKFAEFTRPHRLAPFAADIGGRCNLPFEWAGNVRATTFFGR